MLYNVVIFYDLKEIVDFIKWFPLATCECCVGFGHITDIFLPVYVRVCVRDVV